jgi:Domain of unknown function (DUF5666)
MADLQPGSGAAEPEAERNLPFVKRRMSGLTLWLLYRSYNSRMRLLALSLYVTATVLAQPRLEHVWGRISAINKSGFEVDQNFNADPQSGYRRGMRHITFNSNTKFEGSARQDLRVGRTVDIIGRETTDSSVQATRIIVYEGNAPVRIPAGARVLASDGSVHVEK